MSYKLLPNGKHRWDFRLGRKRVRYTDKDKKHGEKYVRDLQVDYERGSSEAYSHKTLHSCLDGYLQEKLLNRPHKKSYTLKSQIKRLKEFFPDVKLLDFNQPDKAAYNSVSAWMQTYHQSVTGASVNRLFSTLRAAFNWAKKKGYLSENPCKRVSKLKEKSAFPRYLEREEIKALLAASPRPQFNDYCFLILETGMRPEEALTLKWENIDLNRRLIFILDQKNGDKSAIGISDRLVTWLKGRKQGEYVLGGYTYDMLKVDAPKAIKAAKIIEKPGCGKFTIYGLRHTVASHLLMAGEKIETVAKLLRHKDINITYKHYGHLTQDYLRAPLDKLNLLG